MYLHTTMTKRPQAPRKTLVSDAQAAMAACAGWAIGAASEELVSK